MTDEASSQVGLSILPWLTQTIGSDLFAYLLAVGGEALLAAVAGDTALNDKQTEVVAALAALRAAIPGEIDAGGQGNIVRAWLTQVGSDGVAVARSLHIHVSGGETVPPTKDEIETALVCLALDSYPAFLLPPDQVLAPFPERPSIEVSRVLIGHPQNTAFMDAVRKDAVFKKVFQQEEAHWGVYGTVYRNTGGGGTFQLIMFARILLQSAWRHMDNGNMSAAQFAVQTLQELRVMRDVFSGKPHSITAKVGLMGVLLPDSATRLKLPNGVVRSMSEADRKLAPESLKGQLSSMNSDGSHTTVNYDGDLVLEYQYPYKVRAVKPSTGDASSELPQDMRRSSELEDTLLRLRFSLMLAIEREDRAQIAPTWRHFDDPFNLVGGVVGWSDPRQGVGIMPIQLTETEVTAWGEWYACLDTSHVKKVELALSRILRALAERREPSDVLIDSVIAWENLFGTKEGEPTFRVSTCLSVLLEDSFDGRTALKKKATDIYALRSKVVHGSRNLRVDEYPMCQEALKIAIQAIRTLTTTRTDILELPDGAARSSALLLGSGVRQDLGGQTA